MPRYYTLGGSIDAIRKKNICGLFEKSMFFFFREKNLASKKKKKTHSKSVFFVFFLNTHL